MLERWLRGFNASPTPGCLSAVPRGLSVLWQAAASSKFRISFPCWHLFGKAAPGLSLSVCGCLSSLTMKRALFPSSLWLHWASCWFCVRNTLGWQLESISAFDSKATWLNGFYTMGNLVDHYSLSNPQEMWWNNRKIILHRSWEWISSWVFNNTREITDALP